MVCLAAGQNLDRMEAQCRQFHPRLAVMATREAAAALKLRLGDCAIEIMYGMQGLLAAATLPEADAVVTAVVGMLGLRPTLAAIDAGKRICLANKETLVCAGELDVEVKTPDGGSVHANLKLDEADRNLIALLRELGSEKK